MIDHSGFSSSANPNLNTNPVPPRHTRVPRDGEADWSVAFAQHSVGGFVRVAGGFNPRWAYICFEPGHQNSQVARSLKRTGWHFCQPAFSPYGSSERRISVGARGFEPPTSCNRADKLKTLVFMFYVRRARCSGQNNSLCRVNSQTMMAVRLGLFRSWPS